MISTKSEYHKKVKGLKSNGSRRFKRKKNREVKELLKGFLK